MSNSHDPDAPIPLDIDIDDADDLATCAECGAEIYADSDYCSKCGHWQVDGESAGKLDLRRPYRNTKLIAATLLILVGLYSLWTVLHFLLN